MQSVDFNPSPPGVAERNQARLEMGLDESFLLSERSTPVVHASVAEMRQLMYLRLQHAGMTGFSYFLALLLMLVAMSYNMGLLLALVVGYAVGDYVFFKRTVYLNLKGTKNSEFNVYGSGSSSKAEESAWLGQNKNSGECHV